MVLSPSGDCGISGPQKPILTWKHKNPGGPEKEAAWPRVRTARGELAETRHCPHFRGSSAGRFLYPPKGPIIRILSPQVFEAKLRFLVIEAHVIHGSLSFLIVPSLGCLRKEGTARGQTCCLTNTSQGWILWLRCVYRTTAGMGVGVGRPPDPPSHPVQGKG